MPKMSNFEVELRALVEEWIKRGADPKSIVDALYKEADQRFIEWRTT